MNYLIPLMVIIPILCALIVNVIGEKNRTTKLLSLVVGIALPVIALVAVPGVQYFGGHNPTLISSMLPASLNGTLASMFNTGIVYVFSDFEKIFEKKEISGPYLYLIFMGLAAVTALMLSDDIFNMYVFFEITALTQVGIIIATNTDENYEVALKYLILGSVGGPMLLLGIGFILGTIGSLNITDIVYVLNHNLVDPLSPGLVIGFVLILFGWFYVSGLPPFHTIKSAVYSKAFGIALIRIFHHMPYFNQSLVLFAIIAMVLSVSMAAMQWDFRRMIAFLAVGELGFVALGMGIGTELSITAALFQATNEIIISALLFIGFGTVYYLTKTSDTRKLGGLISVNSIMAIMVLLGGFAMAGVPPFNGFMSKLMLVQAAFEAGYPELALIAIFVSITIFFTFVKAFHTIYLQPKPAELKFAHETIPKEALFAVGVLLVVCLILGLCPWIVTNVFSSFIGGLI